MRAHAHWHLHIQRAWAEIDPRWLPLTPRDMAICRYAFATSRRENVERGRLFETPTFEWLDADETKTTTWHMRLLTCDATAVCETGAVLCGLDEPGGCSAG